MANKVENKWKIETRKEIWNNSTGEHYEVGPDRDGLDLIEIVSKDASGHTIQELTITHDVAQLIVKALLDLADTH